MDIKYGLMPESYKCMYGVDAFNDNALTFDSHDISMTVGKNDWAAFQVVISCDDDFTLSVGNNTFFSPKGPLANLRLKTSIDGFSGECNIKTNIIGYVEDDDRTYKTDILLHDETIHVPKNRVQPVWVEINIPEDVRSGIYDGHVQIFKHSMFEDEMLVGCLNFHIDVKNVILPKVSDHKFHLDLWQHLSNIARKHEVALWSDNHFRVIEEYVKSLAILGQKAITVIASEIPWSGQRCFDVDNYLSDLFEYSIIRVTKDLNGKYIYDFSILERYIDLCFRYGMDREIEVFGLTNIWVSPEKGYGAVADDYPDAIRIRYLDKSDGCYKYMKSGKDIMEYIRALEQYFIDKQLIGKVLVVADEPSDVELYQKRLKIIREVAPSFKFKTAINHVEFIGEFKDQITDFVPALSCVCEEWELLNEIKKDINGRLLWYVCCGPLFPNTFIASPLLESRLIGILTSLMNFDGFLRWNYTVWPEHPRQRISFRYPNWSAGDTNFVYPANDGRPMLTLRYKNLKRGIEDYELIYLLKSKSTDTSAVNDKIWNMLFKVKDVKDIDANKNKDREELYSLDYNDYENMKSYILNELECIDG